MRRQGKRKRIHAIEHGRFRTQSIHTTVRDYAGITWFPRYRIDAEPAVTVSMAEETTERRLHRVGEAARFAERRTGGFSGGNAVRDMIFDHPTADDDAEMAVLGGMLMSRTPSARVSQAIDVPISASHRPSTGDHISPVRSATRSTRCSY